MSLVRKLGVLELAVQPNQLVLTHGANDALELVIRYFVPEGEALPDPLGRGDGTA